MNYALKLRKESGKRKESGRVSGGGGGRFLKYMNKIV
jgi:hypothetical protein